MKFLEKICDNYDITVETLDNLVLYYQKKFQDFEDTRIDEELNKLTSDVEMIKGLLRYVVTEDIIKSLKEIKQRLEEKD